MEHVKTLPALTCSNSTIETLLEVSLKLTIKATEQCPNVILVSLLLTFNIFHNLFQYFYCELCTGKYQLESCKKKYTKILIQRFFGKSEYLF